MATPERQLEEHEVTGLIYKVANELQGFKNPDEEAEAIIQQIIELRKSGKLTKGQLELLDGMGQIRSLDYDGF